MTDARNQEQAWFDSEAWFASQMEARAAALVGRAMLDREASELRAQMAAGRTSYLQGRLNEIEAEVGALKALDQGDPPEGK